MKAVTQFVRGLRFLDGRDWGWIHFKIAIGILVPLLAFISAPAPVTMRTLDAGIVRILISVMAAGAILCILGILLRATRVQPLIVGYSVEIAGLVFLFTGPFFLSIGYAYMAFSNGTTYVAAGFCYALSAAMMARFIDVYFHTLESKQPGDPLISKE